MQSELTDQLAVIEMLADRKMLAIRIFALNHVDPPKYFNALSAQEREGQHCLWRQGCSVLATGAARPPSGKRMARGRIHKPNISTQKKK